MGNAVAICCVHQVVRLVRSDGKIVRLNHKMSVEELLTRFPCHYVCDRPVVGGKRKKKASEIGENGGGGVLQKGSELQLGHTYFLLPLPQSTVVSDKIGDISYPSPTEADRCSCFPSGAGTRRSCIKGGSMTRALASSVAGKHDGSSGAWNFSDHSIPKHSESNKSWASGDEVSPKDKQVPCRKSYGGVGKGLDRKMHSRTSSSESSAFTDHRLSDTSSTSSGTDGGSNRMLGLGIGLSNSPPKHIPTLMCGLSELSRGNGEEVRACVKTNSKVARSNSGLSTPRAPLEEMIKGAETQWKRVIKTRKSKMPKLGLGGEKSPMFGAFPEKRYMRRSASVESQERSLCKERNLDREVPVHAHRGFSTLNELVNGQRHLRTGSFEGKREQKLVRRTVTGHNLIPPQKSSSRPHESHRKISIDLTTTSRGVVRHPPQHEPSYSVDKDRLRKLVLQTAARMRISSAQSHTLRRKERTPLLEDNNSSLDLETWEAAGSACQSHENGTYKPSALFMAISTDATHSPQQEFER